MRLLRIIGIVALSVGMFMAVSAFLDVHVDWVKNLLNQTSTLFAMLLYVLLGIATVIVPFTSLIPFIPLAALLWGWWMTAILTWIGWIIGGQIIFEISRLLGRNTVEGWFGQKQLHDVGAFISSRSLASNIVVRAVVQSDMLSYAFALLTPMSRGTFFVITAVGVAPNAVAYAYFGSLSLWWQMGIGAALIIALFCVPLIMPLLPKFMARRLKNVL